MNVLFGHGPCNSSRNRRVTHTHQQWMRRSGSETTVSARLRDNAYRLLYMSATAIYTKVLMGHSWDLQLLKIKDWLRCCHTYAVKVHCLS